MAAWASSQKPFNQLGKLAWLVVVQHMAGVFDHGNARVSDDFQALVVVGQGVFSSVPLVHGVA